jgi:hypothetical protein
LQRESVPQLNDRGAAEGVTTRNRSGKGLTLENRCNKATLESAGPQGFTTEGAGGSCCRTGFRNLSGSRTEGAKTVIGFALFLFLERLW